MPQTCICYHIWNTLVLAVVLLFVCSFQGCGWHTSEKVEFHFDMESLLYIHLYNTHRCFCARGAPCLCRKEMRKVPMDQWDDEEGMASALRPPDGNPAREYMFPHMNALAYYTAAVCTQERKHVPIIGPSLDRRVLSLLTGFCNSQSIEALVCVACGQIHTHVKSWTKRWRKETWRTSGNDYFPAISRRSVELTLLKMLRVNRTCFSNSFELRCFLKRFASDAHPEGNPFTNAQEFAKGCYEWKRRFPAAGHMADGEVCEVLCCPEDVRSTSRCQHAADTLCPHCEIAICNSCYKVCHDVTATAIPMSFGNDNFWGYTTEILYKYEVRWVEAAIVMPCWTTIIVYYVEGDRGQFGAMGAVWCDMWYVICDM